MAEDKEKTKYLGARIPDTLFRAFAGLLKMHGIKQQDWILKRVEEYVEKHWPKGRKPPNF